MTAVDLCVYPDCYDYVELPCDECGVLLCADHGGSAHITSEGDELCEGCAKELETIQQERLWPTN